MWEMEGGRLLGNDEMTVRSLQEYDVRLPGFLAWVLSWINREGPAPIVVYVEGQDRQTETFQEYWLYLGLRGGGGYSNWIFDNNELNSDVNTFMSLNLALQAAVRLARFFEIQTELNLIADFDAIGSSSFMSAYLTTPILAKFVMQSNQLKAGVFAGVYLYMPLLQRPSDTSFEYTGDPPGFIFGMNTAIKLGPGHLILDGRSSHDGRWRHRAVRNEVYYRSSFRFNIGYEWSLFPKKVPGDV